MARKKPRALYNEIDANAANWLRNLIAAGLIMDGDVDERSIKDVEAKDLKGYTQVHLFAGIGGWALSLKMAGWPDGRPIWTGSCPCQPFSSAGVGKGVEDPRHLWPDFRNLLEKCTPPMVFGEQVASKAGRDWLSGVRADLEELGYVVGAADLCAAGVGAPHIRARLFWGGIRMAYAESGRCGRELGHRQEPDGEVAGGGAGYGGSEQPGGHRSVGRGWLADAANGGAGRTGQAEQGGHGQEDGVPGQDCGEGVPWPELSPCPDGDGRWHVGHPYDLCVPEWRLAEIRDDWLASFGVGEPEGQRLQDAGEEPGRPPEPPGGDGRVADPAGEGHGGQGGPQELRPEGREAEDGHPPAGGRVGDPEAWGPQGNLEGAVRGGPEGRGSVAGTEGSGSRRRVDDAVGQDRKRRGAGGRKKGNGAGARRRVPEPDDPGSPVERGGVADPGRGQREQRPREGEDQLQRPGDDGSVGGLGDPGRERGRCVGGDDSEGHGRPEEVRQAEGSDGPEPPVAHGVGLGDPERERGRREQEHAGQQGAPRVLARRPSTGGFWDGSVYILCGDGKARLVEPSIPPLAHGVPARVALLRGAGNAIVPQVAQAFIESFIGGVLDVYGGEK